jgi:predicted small lipoprotein YifL
MKKVLMGMAAIAMIAVLTSCGKKPQAEIDAANAAIEAAKTAEAAVYVPAEFAAVQDSMTAIMADIAAQESKLFKKFGPAKEKLVSTVTLANTVAANAATKKEEVKKETETLMTEVKAMLVENTDLMKKAPRGKEGAAVLEAMKTDMAAIEASLVEAQGMYDGGKYMDANNKVKAAKESATGINTELKEAIAKVKR